MTAEDRLQASIVSYARLVIRDGIVFAVPNGGKRSISTARTLKATGTLAGVSDIILVFQGKVLFAEVKTGKGRATPGQLKFMMDVQALGHHAAIWRSIEDVKNTFAALGIKTRENNEIICLDGGKENKASGAIRRGKIRP